jgi:hypothetical protein
LTITFWNEIILDEIIESHILKSRELRVNITQFCPVRSCSVGLHLHYSEGILDGILKNGILKNKKDLK